MKFPRRAKLFRNPFDMTAYAAVFFLMVIFLVLGAQRYTPGVKIALPVADDLPGTDQLKVAVAVDENGRFYFDNQLIEEPELKTRLHQQVSAANGPLVLLIYADKAVRQDRVLRLALLAREAGLSEAILATLPRPAPQPHRP